MPTESLVIQPTLLLAGCGSRCRAAMVAVWYCRPNQRYSNERADAPAASCAGGFGHEAQVLAAIDAGVAVLVMRRSVAMRGPAFAAVAYTASSQIGRASC